MASDRISKLSNHLTSSPTSSSSSSRSIHYLNSLNGLDDYFPLFPSDSQQLPFKLSLQQEQQYIEQGFFLVKNLIKQNDIHKFTQRFLHICNGEVKAGPEMTIMRDIVLAKQNKANKAKDSKFKSQEEVTKIQDWQDDEILMEYVRDKEVLKYVSAVIGDNVRSIHTMLINKPPDLGKGSSKHPWHQDLLYFPMRPASRIMASWTALEKIDDENGCLHVIPGTHKMPLLPHNQPDEFGNKAYESVRKDLVEFCLNDLGYPDVALHMDPGDTVFFHPSLIHGSGINTSGRFRKAISCHYASGLCNFTEIPEHNYTLVDEVMEIVKRKYGLDASKFSQEQKLEVYQLVWKVKSRQILGQERDEWTIKPLSFTTESLML